MLATLYRDGAVLDTALDQVWAELADEGVCRLAFGTAPVPAGPEREVAALEVIEALVTSHLGPVADSLHREMRIGRRVLRGAVAHAIVSALLHMSWSNDDRARYVGAARVLLGHVSGLAELVTVDVVRSVGEPWMYFDRNTCCLAFRTTANQAREQPFCSVCPVLPAATTMALFARATGAYAARHPRR